MDGWQPAKNTKLGNWPGPTQRGPNQDVTRNPARLRDTPHHIIPFASMMSGLERRTGRRHTYHGQVVIRDHLHL